MERWLEDIRMAIDLAEQSISPNTDLLSDGLPGNSKPIYYVRRSMHPFPPLLTELLHNFPFHIFVILESSLMAYIAIYANQHLSNGCQSCQRTVGLSWSLRMNSAARAPPWSGRVTAATPLCTSAGIATPACQWWTSVLLWRYQAPLLLILYSAVFRPFSPVSVLFIGWFCFGKDSLGLDPNPVLLWFTGRIWQCHLLMNNNNAQSCRNMWKLVEENEENAMVMS